MLFNSAIFLAFASLFFAVWFGLRTQRQRLAWLTLASLVFYSWWDWRFVFLIVLSGTTDFLAALAIVRARAAWRTALLAAAIGVNLAILLTFKYLGFFAALVERVLDVELGAGERFAHIVLPIGISFYTFQSMCYTIDVYRGRLEPTRSPLVFFAYLSMFPQLVAGPIERGPHLLPQLASWRNPSPAQCREGWTLIVLGYCKKSLVADNIAPLVDEAFASPEAHASASFWWLIATLFAVQIYCDFSGYTDIARGLARFMGVELMRNFASPYQARSLREFWSRWHISLSSWFRDYVYIPLGGNRRGPVRTHLNLWATLLLSGLWHGAAPNFVAWGAYHALFLSLERLSDWPRRLARVPVLGPLAAQALVSCVVIVSWVPFRAESLADARHILAVMLAAGDWSLPAIEYSYALAAGAGAVCASLAVTLGGAASGPNASGPIASGPIASGRHRERVSERSLWLFWLAPLIVVVTVYFRGPGHAFIYFQF